MTFTDVNFLTKCMVPGWDTVRFLVKCVTEAVNTTDFTTFGKTFDDFGMVSLGKNNEEISFIVLCTQPFNYVYKFDESEISNFKIYSDFLTNEVTIYFNYDFVSNKARASITKHNPISKSIYGDNPSFKKVYEMKKIQEQSVANKIADAILKTRSLPPILCSFRHNVRSFYLEEHDPVIITHPSGLDTQGYIEAAGYITSRGKTGKFIDYEIMMKPLNTALLKSELVRLSLASGVGRGEGVTIEYEAGVVTVTVFANNVAGNPVVEGVTVRIASITQFTNSKGQAFFNLSPGTYTAYLSASGYEDSEVRFTI